MTKIVFLIILSFLILSNFALAYSVNPSATPTASSIFGQNPLKYSPIDISKFIKTSDSGLGFSDLVNTKSFSSQDIGSSVKAILVLFIKLIITTLNVTLGILKTLIDLLTLGRL